MDLACNRQERHFQRQRGAGARDIKTHFSFDFVSSTLPVKLALQENPTSQPALPQPKASSKNQPAGRGRTKRKTKFQLFDEQTLHHDEDDLLSAQRDNPARLLEKENEPKDRRPGKRRKLMADANKARTTENVNPLSEIENDSRPTRSRTAPSKSCKTVASRPNETASEEQRDATRNCVLVSRRRGRPPKGSKRIIPDGISNNKTELFTQSENVSEEPQETSVAHAPAPRRRGRPPKVLKQEDSNIRTRESVSVQESKRRVRPKPLESVSAPTASAQEAINSSNEDCVPMAPKSEFAQSALTAQSILRENCVGTRATSRAEDEAQPRSFRKKPAGTSADNEQRLNVKSRYSPKSPKSVVRSAPTQPICILEESQQATSATTRPHRNDQVSSKATSAESQCNAAPSDRKPSCMDGRSHKQTRDKQPRATVQPLTSRNEWQKEDWFKASVPPSLQQLQGSKSTRLKFQF